VLMKALAYGNYSHAQLLLDAGADMEAKNNVRELKEMRAIS